MSRNHKFVSARIQTEYDSFLYRSVSCLYDNKDKTTWQYLVMLPFGQVSSHMVVNLFHYVLHTKSGSFKWSILLIYIIIIKVYFVCIDSNECSLEELSECIVNISDDECYYILTAISNMALSRYINDIDFIKSVTIYLFKVRMAIINYYIVIN